MDKNNPTEASNNSTYVDEAYYDRVVALGADWRDHGVVSFGERPDNQIRDDCEALLHAEARYADTLELERWIGCYSADCLYWIPASTPARDPRLEITHEIHDRRRLDDRVARIRTGFAYSMIPPIRTTRVLGNLELWYGEESEIRARASFIIDVITNHRRRVVSGWNGYALVLTDGEWRIAVKQINLLDADFPQENNSFFL